MLHRCLYASLVLLLFFSLFMIPVATYGAADYLLISEVLYDPAASEPGAEWVELYNPTSNPIDLASWAIRDNTSADPLPAFILGPGQHLVITSNEDDFRAANPGFSAALVSLGGPIGNGLSNSGDVVSLLDGSGRAIDEMSYGSNASAFDPPCPDVNEGQSLARQPVDADTNSAGDWVAGTPTPGGASQPSPTATGTPTWTFTPPPTSSSEPTAAPSATATPPPISTPTPSPTATASDTPVPTSTEQATGTPTGTLAPAITATVTLTNTKTPTATSTVPGGWPRLLLSEVLYDAVQGGTDSEYEWIEVHNPTTATVSLVGWWIQDNAGQDELPAFELAPGEFAVIAARTAVFMEEHPAFSGKLVGLKGTIGNGLSNSGDVVRLLAPDNSVIVAMSYGTNNYVFDPPCWGVDPGQSLARFDGVGDSDTALDWQVQAPPNPGAPAAQATPTPTPTPSATPTLGTPVTPTVTATATATATPTLLPPQMLQITLNEVLPDPERGDWDGDGEANFMDEWIELYSAADLPAALDGWIISDDSSSYRIPAGTVIWPQGYLLLYRTQTRLSLGDWRDTITLTRSDGSLADQFAYNGGPGNDRSYCRDGDGWGEWTGDCEVTPGAANRRRPSSPPSQGSYVAPTATVPQTVAAARAAPQDTRATITGIITLPPGLIPKTIYVQDATGGIKAYLRSGEYGDLVLGDQVRVTGWTRHFYGETELSVPDPGYITYLGPGTPVTPLPVTSAGLTEANEGRLVQVVGSVVKFEPQALVLGDRSGAIRIYFPESLPWQRPYVNIGEMWAAQGVLGQHTGEKVTGSGYQIIPRFRSDVVNGPAFLPVTGARTNP